MYKVVWSDRYMLVKDGYVLMSDKSSQILNIICDKLNSGEYTTKEAFDEFSKYRNNQTILNVL